MRILQLIDSLDSGGAERMAVNYANMLSKEKPTFICVTRSEGLLKNTINDGVNYMFLNKKHTLDFKAIKRLYIYVRKNKIDVIHAHSTSFFLATIIKILNNKITLVWHDHYGSSEFLKARKFKILKICSYKFNAIISVNQTLKVWAEQHLKCKKVSFLNNFISVSTKEKKETVLRGEKGKRMVCLANLRSQKNHFMLLDAFKEVNKTHDKWTLHLVGKDHNDIYSSKLNEKINDLKLSKNVFIYGSKSDIYHILNHCDIGVLSSQSEGLPLALLEYGLAKLPVVATNVGDCDKVITQPSEGCLVNSGDFKAFSKALLNYINNTTLRIESGEGLYKNVVLNFSENKIKDQLIEIYTTLKCLKGTII
ncbi:glycosyltransferase [Flavivirga sp. 57AJ16]|uniref:glycosyltransferase n=1 Tax=Flavivirga sp. 57AJ16 TaxID=3025307 RepID=UPI002366CA9B|nr:glycosyltransferase [Flavivirga sp. 57AJ16]MDD7885165.1 glycosyltransferase [Flavivirga sp. 57AJ16]